MLNAAPASSVADMRSRADTFLVRSSASPIAKAGRPQTAVTANVARTAGGAATAAAQNPANTATPPMRGATCRCTFCGPLKLSRLSGPCQRRVTTISTLAASETPTPSRTGSPT